MPARPCNLSAGYGVCTVGDGGMIGVARSALALTTFIPEWVRPQG